MEQCMAKYHDIAIFLILADCFFFFKLDWTGNIWLEMVENDPMKTNNSISIFHDGLQRKDVNNEKMHCNWIEHILLNVELFSNALLNVVSLCIHAVVDFSVWTAYTQSVRLKRRDVSNGPINYNRITFHHTQKPHLW